MHNEDIKMVTTDTIWGHIDLDFCNAILASQSKALHKKEPGFIAKYLGYINDDQHAKTVSENVGFSFEKLYSLYPHLLGVSNEIYVLYNGILRIKGIYRFDIYPGVTTNYDIAEYLKSNDIFPISYLEQPVLCFSNIENLKLVESQFNTSDILNPLVLWFLTRKISPLFAYVSDEELSVRLDTLNYTPNDRSFSKDLYQESTLPESFSPLLELVNYMESNLVHNAILSVVDEQVVSIKLIHDTEMEGWKHTGNTSFYQAIKTMYQMINIGMSTVLKTPSRGRIVIERDSISDFDEQTETACVLNSIPTNHGLQISLSLQFSSEIENELDKDESIIGIQHSQGIFLSCSLNKSIMHKRMYSYLRELYHENNGVINAIALDDAFSIWVNGICHIEHSENILSILPNYIDSGFDTLIVGEIKTPKQAYLSTSAVLLGMKVIGCINSPDLNVARNKIVQFSELEGLTLKESMSRSMFFSIGKEEAEYAN